MSNLIDVSSWMDTFLKALQETAKYGISDTDNDGVGFISEDESIIRQTLKIYQKYGSEKNITVVSNPIALSKVTITQEETFIEVLKTIQKLAKLENLTKEEQLFILTPIERLLNHENENVRKMAQETLNKILK